MKIGIINITCSNSKILSLILTAITGYPFFFVQTSIIELTLTPDSSERMLHKSSVFVFFPAYLFMYELKDFCLKRFVELKRYVN